MKRAVFPLLLGLLFWLLFLFFQAQGIYGGDSGDLVTAARFFGVPHPPGYPLYTFLGGLLTWLPFSTPAWRVGLLSSLSHAAVALLIYFLVRRLTGKVLPALAAALAAVGNYLFFLYAVTPEVFALFDLFIILLLYLAMVWVETRNTKYLYFGSFILGLALSHHQVILFMLPALVYWLRIHLRSSKLLVGRCLVLFGLGLSPYLYLPLAARGSAIINWDRAVDLSGFIRLISRADYGTFVSSGYYGAMLFDRFLQLKAYFQFLLLDFKWIGIGLTLLGLFWLWRYRKTYFRFWLIAVFFLGPGFFFYASFPLMNRFTVGTYERFLLPSYVLLYPLLGLGMWQLWDWWQKLTVRKNYRLALVAGRVLLTTAVCIYLFMTLGMTLWRFWGLPADRTAENLANDILESVPSGSILFLIRDTPLFTTQYVRYALGKRPDVVALHFHRLGVADYQTTVAKVFPELSIPGKTGEKFVDEFIKANREKYPIYANAQIAVDKDWFWVPHGLLYRLTTQSELPSVTAMLETNQKLWVNYHDPTRGLLSRYNHLMLADVRDVYATARISLGKTLLRAGLTSEAKEQFNQAINLGGDTQLSDAYVYRGLTELFSKNCEAALGDFASARKAALVDDKFFSLYEATTYQDCVGNQEQAKRLFEDYEKKRAIEQTPLEKL